MANKTNIAREIFGVSLGPGDPELITLKGLNVLKAVDKIYYPGSIKKDGSTDSYSLSILHQLNIPKPNLEGFFLEMSEDRENANKVYSNTFNKIKEEYFKGLSIAIVSEGDISFYSSFIYLLEKFKYDEIPVNLITGASSFLAGAAFSKIPISLQNEKVAIIPRVKNLHQLIDYIFDFETVVLMKIKSVFAIIVKALEVTGALFVYCERLGTSQEYTTSNLECLKDREIPYFSLIILKKQQ